MLATRVIPTLLLRNSGLVKGSKFKDHKYVGDPVNAVRIFNTKEVDELVFLDIAATPAHRKPNYSLLADIASQAFMPFGYGGGLTSIADIEALFKIGIEKAILNTAAVHNLEFVRNASDVAGAQSIVVSIDVRKSLLGKHQVFTQSGQLNTKLDPVELAKRVEEAGAGEIILTSIDKEGTGSGYDLELIRKVSSAVGIPVVASGGAGNLKHLQEAAQSGASAVAAGSMFTFHGKHRAVLITYPEYTTLERLFEESA